MRKVLTIIFLATIILIGGSAHAQDVYVGTSEVTGRNCYVMTETIYWAHGYECEATLKMVRPSDGNVQRLHYRFVSDIRSNARFENSQGFSGRVTRDYPIEWAMWKFLCDYSERHDLRK